MSLPIQQDPGNPGSANSVHWQQTQKAVVKRSPATGSDWVFLAQVLLRPFFSKHTAIFISYGPSSGHIQHGDDYCLDHYGTSQKQHHTLVQGERSHRVPRHGLV
jgi:hypothetical protein